MEADLYLNLAGVLVCQCEMFCNFREACVDSIAQDTYPLNTFTLPPLELRQKWRQTWS